MMLTQYNYLTQYIYSVCFCGIVLYFTVPHWRLSPSSSKSSSRPCYQWTYLSSVSTLKSTVWCPLQCNPPSTPHSPGWKVIVSKYPSPQNNTHTHAGIPLCCISTHSPLETNIISIVCVVALGCIFLFPLWQYSHFSLLIVVYAIPWRLIVV